MKIKKPKRIMSLFLAALMCVTSLVGMGTTAYAAEETDDVYLISFPRDGDSNYNAEWGHGSLTFMNGWKTGTSRYTTVRAMGSYEGNICYCIEIGVPQQTGDSFTKKGEDFWDNYPSSYNSTISPDDIKLFIGRIFQYGYTGTISTSWRSQNEGGDKLAHAVATQLLIWETVIGERDENFNKVSTGGKDAVLDQISPNHPLYDKIMSYYNSMAASVQKHTQLFQQLFYSADHIHGGSLPIPVHFLMDEFANVSLPDDFDKILSVMRSRGVSVSIILQNLAQLKALFEKQWESIVGNCDEFLYLGGNEQSTHKYVSELLGKETIDTNTYGKSEGRSGSYSTNYQISGRELLTPDEVRMLDNRYAILFIRGELPVMDLKYDILKHPNVAYKEYSSYGCPYVQENCDVLKPSDNVVIYGHHMNNGSMFADLEKFKDEDFWREHKTIAFNTLTEKNEYEILAVFKTVVYTDSPEAFKYYRFTDAQSPEEFDAYIEKCKELSLYDTGVSAEYGDKLITLSTCEYSRTNGRLVVVAKKVTESSGANAPANDGAAEIPS